jgi:hypothetical protein
MVPPAKYVTDAEIRKHFNDGGYFERTETGAYTITVTDVGPSKRVPAARSQMVRYRDQQGRNGSDYLLPTVCYLDPGGLLAAEKV